MGVDRNSKLVGVGVAVVTVVIAAVSVVIQHPWRDNPPGSHQPKTTRTAPP